MEITEIKDLLNKMNALAEDTESIDSVALMQDPIVLNRLAVELLQQVDRDSKPELVIAPEGIESYFGYSVALAAWMRFLCAHKAEDGSFSRKRPRLWFPLPRKKEPRSLPFWP